MWEGLDAVDWARLKHNYGTAEDVPGLLHRCAGPDEGDAEEAADDLLNLIYHQGGWICPAAVAVLPFLLRLGADPEVRCRRTLLDLVAVLAAEAGRVAERFLDPGWPAAWERALPEVLALVTAPEPEIRRAAADILADCTSPGALVLPALLDRWRTETDLATRLDLVVALGAAGRREPAGPRADEALSLLHGLLDEPEPQLRLAAVRALARRDPGLAEGKVDLLLDAVRDPGVAVWQHTSAVGGGVQAVQHRVGSLFRDSPASYTSYALGLLADHPDDEQRVGALVQTAGVLRRWRSPVDELLPAVAARLDDPSPEVRFRAVELLACLGPAAADYADAVAALLDDTGRSGRRRQEAVADAALWALARMNDGRCVPGLIERVAGAPSTFSTYGAFSSEDFHIPRMPALHEALTLLPDYADLLLPAVCDRISATGDEQELARLCEVLADWGPGARPAVPRLVPLLERDGSWEAVAKALGGIGVADGAARELLLARAEGGGAGGGRASMHGAAGEGRAAARGAAGQAQAAAREAGGTETPAPGATETQASAHRPAGTRASARGTGKSGPADPSLAAWAYWRAGGDPERALAVLGPAATESGFRHPHLRRLADLGPHAAGVADRVRALAQSEDAWTSVEAAHALWAATGETEVPVQVLLAAVRDLADGRYLPVMLTAVRHLTRIGAPARPAARHLHEVPQRDERLFYFGSWRAFATDESIRAAVGELLAGPASVR